MNIFICLCLMLSSIFARTLKPEEMARMAEEHMPLLKMQMEGYKSASSQTLQSRTLPNPFLTIQSGSLKSATQAGAVMDVTINQPFPWPGKRAAAIQSAKVMRGIAELDLEEAKIIVNHSTILLSLELASLVELEKHHQERRKRFSLIQRFFTTRPLASPKQAIDKNLIETQIRLIEGQMYELVTRKQAILEELQLMTGEMDPQILMTWKEIPQPPTKDQFAQMLGNNFRLRRVGEFKELAESRVSEARHMAKPDIIFGLNYRQENIAPTNHFYHANFGIVIPIIDRGQHSVEIARAHVRKEEANKRLTMLEVSTALNTNYQSLLAAHRISQLFKFSELNNYEKRFQRAEDSFLKGRIDVMTFLQMDTQTHESIDLAYTSYLKYYTSLSKLLALVGQKLDI